MPSLPAPPIVRWPVTCSAEAGVPATRYSLLRLRRKVDATNNVSERALRPSVIQRKVTNGYRAKWAADAEAALRSTVNTSRLAGNQPPNHPRRYHCLIVQGGWVVP
ncbi:MAG: transposase [Sphingomonadaceae bacterium]